MQPQINADLFRATRSCCAIFYGYVDIPATTRILRERTLMDTPTHGTTEPHTKILTHEAKFVVFLTYGLPIKRHPPKRTTTSVAQFALAGLIAGTNVLVADGLYRLRMQAKFFAATGHQFLHVEFAWPSQPPADGMPLRVIAKVENRIDGISPSRQ